MIVSNIEKEKILMKQFITKSDIKKITNGGSHKKTVEIFERANELNGENVYKDRKYVNVDNVLRILGIKASDIRTRAEMERKLEQEKGASVATDAPR